MLTHHFAIVLLMSSLAFVWCRNSTWDYFVFAQEWLVAECIYAAQDHKKCVVPSYVKGWTIHGLWPTLASVPKEPCNCNKSWHFNFNEIKSLQKDLDIYWPNLFVNTAKIAFWKDEWIKHGTCATSLPATRNESMFFKKTLELRQKIDIERALQKFDIIPSLTKSYKVIDIKRALRKSFRMGLSQPLVVCFSREHMQTMHLRRIEICLTKDFNFMKCAAQLSRSVCKDDDDVILNPRELNN